MKTTTENPLDVFHSSLNTLFNEALTSFSNTGLGFKTQSSFPKIEIIDSLKEIKIIALVAGYQKEDINISLREDKLTICGNAKDSLFPESKLLTSTDDSEKIIYSEIKKSSFSRELYINSQKLETDKLTAKLDGGILTITIPRKNINLPNTQKIQIQ